MAGPSSSTIRCGAISARGAPVAVANKESSVPKATSSWVSPPILKSGSQASSADEEPAQSCYDNPCKQN